MVVPLVKLEEKLPDVSSPHNVNEVVDLYKQL